MKKRSTVTVDLDCPLEIQYGHARTEGERYREGLVFLRQTGHLLHAKFTSPFARSLLNAFVSNFTLVFDWNTPGETAVTIVHPTKEAVRHVLQDRDVIVFDLGGQTEVWRPTGEYSSKFVVRDLVAEECGLVSITNLDQCAPRHSQGVVFTSGPKVLLTTGANDEFKAMVTSGELRLHERDWYYGVDAAPPVYVGAGAPRAPGGYRFKCGDMLLLSDKHRAIVMSRADNGPASSYSVQYI